MRHLRTGWGDETGSTLVELLVTITVLAVGMLGVFVTLDTASATTKQSLSREGATTLAREVLERARQLPYRTLADAGHTAGDQVRAVMPDASTTRVDARSFTLTRRNQAAYTVRVTACKVDATVDGIGPHDPSFCASGTSADPGDADGSSTIAASLLGYPIALSGDVVGDVCRLLGTTPSDTALNGLLGRTGASSLNALLAGGADLRTCPTAVGSASGTVAVDGVPDDLTRVRVTVSWAAGRRAVAQTALVPNA